MYKCVRVSYTLGCKEPACHRLAMAITSRETASGSWSSPVNQADGVSSALWVQQLVNVSVWLLYTLMRETGFAPWSSLPQSTSPRPNKVTPAAWVWQLFRCVVLLRHWKCSWNLLSWGYHLITNTAPSSAPTKAHTVVFKDSVPVPMCHQHSEQHNKTHKKKKWAKGCFPRKIQAGCLTSDLWLQRRC